MNFEQLARHALELAVAEIVHPDASADPVGDAETLRIAAVIGFAGDHVRGTLGVATNTVGLAKVAGLFGLTPEAPAVDESMGELANLLLGHIKRSFGRHGVEVSLATPLVIRGLAIEVQGGREGQWIERHDNDGASRITTWIDAEPTPELVVSAEVVDEGIADQGDALFF